MGHVSWCLLSAVVWLPIVLPTDLYSNQPKLITDDGNLVIMTASDRNITLRTSGRGYVNLNEHNLLHVTQMAQRASASVSQFQQNLENNIQGRLDTLYRQISGPQGLAKKLASLEQAVYRGNISSGLVPHTSTTISRLNRQAVRIRRVENQLRSLQTLLIKDECLSNPCRNGGTCQDLFNNFICVCPTNWQGALCDVDVNECAMYAGTDLGCQNGGTCINKLGTYECLCPDTFFGLHCTLRTNDCSSANSAQLCGNGVCVNQGGTGRGYTCICNQGWTTDTSQSCTVDVDECQAKRYPCSHDPYVPCINLPGSYHCGFCPPGYSGNGFQCADIDECKSDNGGCSQVPKVPCINTMGSRVCGSCPAGFSGDGVTCLPVAGGACAINNGGCFPTAHCFLTGGIVNCQCPVGYAGSGYGPTGCSPSALAVNPCHNNPCRNGGTCVAIGSTATCSCHPHTTGPDCAQLVNASCNPNPCQNNGQCSIIGNGVFSEIRCTCSSGYEGSRCEYISSGCGGVFSQDSGELKFPNPGIAQQYDRGQLCTWHIEVFHTKVVEVNITELMIDPSENCRFNYLKIIDPMPLGTTYIFCKQYDAEKPTINVTLSNKADVTYFSSTGIHINTFKLSWKAVEPVCGREISATTHGIIESPHFLQAHPVSLNCEWKIFAPPGKKIQFTFNSLNLQPSRDCSKDYIQIREYEYSDPGNMIAQYCNSSNPVSVTTHLNAAYIFFHSDGTSHIGKGFRIMYTLIEGCGGILTDSSGDISPPKDEADEYHTHLNCEWRIQLPVGNKIKLVFKNKFDVEDSDPCTDYVQVRDGPSLTSPLVGQWCGSILPPPFISTSQFLTIIFHSDFLVGQSGFTIHYETMCGGEFTSVSGEIKTPNYPLPYSQKQSCVYLISTPLSTAIQLHFQDFDLEYLEEACIFDYLEIHDGDNANATLIGRYCEHSPGDVLSTHNYLYLVFTADESDQYRGFLANYSTIDIPCGGIMKQLTGTFHAPLNEDGYLPDLNCVWVISAEPGWVIELSWLSFHLEHSQDCTVDTVEIYENNTVTGEGLLVDKYCGLHIPPATRSTTNMMTVKFHSDDTVHGQGFTANYIMVDKRKVCGGTYRTITGTVETPNYPEQYPDNKECTWVIHVPQGQQIKLTFEVFNIEDDPKTCFYDSLIIRNGLHETSPLVGKYCGSDLPPDVISFSNALWIHFSSDRSVGHKGFKASWDATSTGCGGTLTGMSGSIMSPNYPQPYRRYAECSYKISASQGSRVQLFIVDLDLESHIRCRLDYIEVFDGLEDRSPSLGRFCNPDQHPPSILGSANNMFIKFVSDISYNGRGFNIKYHTVCNVTLKSRYGAIESPNYPNNYNPNLNCMWVIQAPLGNRLNITIDHFELEHGSHFISDKGAKECNYDYLEILQSSLKESTPQQSLVKICGEGPETNLFSTTVEKAYIHFVTDHMTERAGFRLEWAVVGCGGVLRKPEGSFTSPNYPQGYPTNIECEWEIIAPWDKSIQITLRELHMEDIGECSFDHFAIYAGEDDTAPLLIKACHHQTTPQTFTTSGNHAFIRFQSDFSNSGRGFFASWKFVNAKCGGKFTSPFGAIYSHNYPNNYNNEDDCEWIIEVPENHLVNLTFTDFDVEPSSENTTTDYVNVYDGSSVKAPLLLSHSGNELPQPASVISSGNTMLIRHKADGSLTAKGFSAYYRLACGARISANGTGTFSLSDIVSAESPWGTDSEVNCTWYIIAQNPADKITLTFTLLDLSPSEENDEDNCSYNYVAVHDGDDTQAHILSRVCGTKVPPALRSSGSALTVHVASLTSRRSHLGRFTALYSTYSSACGGDLVSEQGSFASPNFPNGYPGDADCEWQIVASAGNKVSVSFSSFELEQSEYCNTDYVEVRSGASNGALLGVFCGSDLPTNITAQSVLWLRFRSDSLNTAAGFMADYSLVHGNELEGNSGQIASPLYPHRFIQQGDYKWTITVPNNKVVRITFSDFYIDKYDESECHFSLQIFDGPSVEGSSPTLLEACGATIPSPVVSHGNTVAILFRNDPYVHGSLFLLNWEAVSRDRAFPPSIANTSEENFLGCGKLIHLSPNNGNHSAVFTSPNHPQNYDNNLNCSWILDTSAGFHLQLKFTVFDLETYEDCTSDFVKVYAESEMKVSGWRAISDSLCLHSTTDLNFQAGNRMKVTLITDDSIKKTGFSALATTVCGGTLTSPSGSLNTTALPANSTTKMVKCEWLIVVRSGRTIQFKFTNFNLPKHRQDSCGDEYIMFRNGAFNDSPHLGEGKYCGDVLPIIPPSTSNRVFLSYSAIASFAGVFLEYEEVDFACDHKIVLGSNLPSKVISTPNYPQVPSTSHITCSWSVTVPPGESVHLNFIDRFDLKPSKDCTVEYLEVYDGGTELSPLVGRYCTTTPSPITAQSNNMFIKYFTDTETPNNGFKALASIATCGGTYWGLYTPLTLTSPQYPSKYPPRLDCVWKLVGYSEDTQLLVNITELFLGGESEQCNDTSDFIEFVNVDIVTKNMTDIPPATKLCGQRTKELNGSVLVPPSSSNEMYIRFHSGKHTNKFSKLRFALTITVKRQFCTFEVNAPSGVITSRGYPTPTSRASWNYCVWTIVVPEGRRVSLKLVDFDPEPLRFPTQLKLMFFSASQLVGGFSESSEDYTKPVESFGNILKIVYSEESLSGAHRGFKAEFSSDKPTFCGGVLEDNGYVGFSALGQNLTQYICKWTHTQDPQSTNQSTFTITINGTISKPRNASSPVCSFFTTDYDSVLISTPDSSPLSGILAIICQEDKLPYVLRTSESIVNIMVRKSTFFSLKKSTPSIANFIIAFKTDLCGGLITGPRAVITSPGFPNQYPPYTDCAWTVKFQPGTTIRVVFDQLDLDADCTNDFLVLYNGKTQMKPHLTRPLCGNQAPSQIITQTSDMLVEFHSGSVKSSHSGFKIVLEEETTGCGGTLHDVSTIKSPNFGISDYPNNVECDWKVILSPGFHAGIAFQDRFSLESSTGCTNDFIQVFDWTNETWVQIGGNICGRVPPMNITTKTNQFRVLFRTSSSVTSDGFWMVWTKLCGGIFQVSEGGGMIISPNYPRPYADNLNCKYTLLSASKTIYGSFDDFAVEETQNGAENRCKFDNVTLTTHSLVQRRFPLSFLMFRLPLTKTTTQCGFQIPEPVFSYGSLELVFQTDSYSHFKGFLFRYSVASCGTNITSPTTISNPSNRDINNCTWFITAPEDKVVSVKLQIDRGFSSVCGLKIYDGHNLTNETSLIVNACSTFINKRERYISTGNKVAVQYYDSGYRATSFTLHVSFTYGEKHNCGGTIRLEDVRLPYTLKSVDVNADGKYEPQLACDWLLLAPESHQIYLSFLKFDLQNCTNCECDFLEIHDGDHNGMPKIGRFCGSTLPLSPTVISSSGSLLVHFSSDGDIELSGFQLSVSTHLSECGEALRNASSSVQVLKSPGFPDHLPGGSHLCRWFIFPPDRMSGMLSLHITDLDLPSPCTNNYLEISDMWIMSRFLLDGTGYPWDHRAVSSPMKLCGNRTTEITFIGRSALVRLVTNSDGTHKGFSMNYMMKGCSSNYTQPFGHLKFNHLYFKNSESCYNLIQAPHSNATISLYFNSFMCFDHGQNPSKLKIYDGSSDAANEVLSVCSTESPNPVFSTGPSLFMKWEILHFLAKYDITYTTTDKGRGCGGRFSDVTGSFSSPPYSSSHNVVSSCRWDVTVPHGNKITFNFRYFDVGPCTSNQVKFFDVNTFTGAETLHSQYCGREMPAEIQMTGDSAFVQYIVTTHNNETRWVLHWAAVPNPQFT